MIRQAEPGGNSTLFYLMLVYGATSLLHFAHNAVYLQAYPNLPASLTEAGVFAAWTALTAVGVLGYWLHRRNSRQAGLLTIAIYGAFGFAGLDHYVAAPIAAHSIMMNATIFLEVLAATALLAYVARSILMPRQIGGRA